MFRPAPGITLSLVQPESGYRFNADSIHLVHFARVGAVAPVDTLADLGAGCGVIGISLLALGAARRGAFLELDADQAARCTHNLAQHQLQGEVLVGHVADTTPPRPCGLVVCNPPYFAPDEGRTPQDHGRTQARFGGIEHFVRAAARCCAPKGRTCFVYPARSAMRLLEALKRAGLEPKRVAWVHARPGAPARLILVEARRGKPGGLVVEAARIEQL